MNEVHCTSTMYVHINVHIHLFPWSVLHRCGQSLQVHLPFLETNMTTQDSSFPHSHGYIYAPIIPYITANLVFEDSLTCHVRSDLHKAGGKLKSHGRVISQSGIRWIAILNKNINIINIINLISESAHYRRMASACRFHASSQYWDKVTTCL